MVSEGKKMVVAPKPAGNLTPATGAKKVVGPKVVIGGPKKDEKEEEKEEKADTKERCGKGEGKGKGDGKGGVACGDL